ncbi:MAG: universal stress protein [Candidatus Macondimonas sp.]
MYHRILLAYNGSPEGRAVLHQGTDLAQLCNAEVCLLAVVGIPAGLTMAETVVTPEMTDALEAPARRTLEEGAKDIVALGLTVQTRIEFGEPVERIGAVAREYGADLIVVGHRHRGALARWWGGSVGKSLLGQIPCDLLVALDTQESAAQP